MERLQKFLANAGVASRREAERWIADGRISVNGEVVREAGVKVEPGTDCVEVDGKPVTLSSERHTIMLNKPEGIVTTLKDRHAERTVLDLLTELPWRLYPVGRLDKDTTGLLILTDDGDLAHALMHPGHQVDKVYRVTVQGLPSPEAMKTLRQGVELSDGKTSPAKVEIFQRLEGQTILEMTIHEGRKRQIRRMVATVGHPAVRLTRIRVGPIELGALPVGEYRPLTHRELRALREVVRSVPASADKGGTTCSASKTGMKSNSPQSGPRSASISTMTGKRGGSSFANARRTTPSKRGSDR